MYEQKYLKYKQKYLELKNSMHGGGCNSCGSMNGVGCGACGTMRGGVILKNLNYKRTEVVLPESFDIGNVVSFVGELSYKEKPVGKAIILYYISDVLSGEYRSRSVTRGTSLQPELDTVSTGEYRSRSVTRGISLQPELVTASTGIEPVINGSTGSIPVEPLITEPTHNVKIDVTLILFDMTVYKFSNDNIPIRLVAAANRTLAPYAVNTTLNLKRNTNAEKDLTMQYVIESGKGTFTINP
jgi:hypothetical protein